MDQDKRPFSQGFIETSSLHPRIKPRIDCMSTPPQKSNWHYQLPLSSEISSTYLYFPGNIKHCYCHNLAADAGIDWESCTTSLISSGVNIPSCSKPINSCCREFPTKSCLRNDGSPPRLSLKMYTGQRTSPRTYQQTNKEGLNSQYNNNKHRTQSEDLHIYSHRVIWNSNTTSSRKCFVREKHVSMSFFCHDPNISKANLKCRAYELVAPVFHGVNIFQG